MDSPPVLHSTKESSLLILITNLNSDFNISDGSSRDAETMEVEILTLSLPTTTVNNINVPLPSGNETRAYKWQMDPDAPNLTSKERSSIRKAISDKERRDKEKLKLLQAEKMIQQKNDTISQLSESVSRLEQDFRQYCALNKMLLARKGNICNSLMDNAVSTSSFDLLDYTTLLVNPLTLEPPAITNKSDSLFSDGVSSVVGAVEMETSSLSPPPTTVNDNNARFDNETKRNGRRFKWTMNPMAPNLRMEQRRSIMKAKSCRGQRDKEKQKYAQLQKVLKQKHDLINRLLGRITQLEGDNEKLSANNKLLIENETEERNDNSYNDRENELMDVVDSTSKFEMESFY